jgi:2'-5' RNA ligase
MISARESGIDDAARMRLFVAIPVPQALTGVLQQVQRELQEVVSQKSAAWTRPENMHLTLRFLGDVNPDRVGELQERLRAATAGFGGLRLVCERLGCFPDLRFPQVVWAWVHDAQERLPQLVQRVNEATAAFAGQAADARFVGHITVARPRRLRPPEAKALAAVVKAAVAREFGTWPAEALELIRSELSASGSRYTSLARFQLTRSGPK